MKIEHATAVLINDQLQNHMDTEIDQLQAIIDTQGDTRGDTFHYEANEAYAHMLAAIIAARAACLQTLRIIDGKYK